jgi:hypothetical protein
MSRFRDCPITGGCFICEPPLIGGPYRMPSPCAYEPPRWDGLFRFHDIQECERRIAHIEDGCVGPPSPIRKRLIRIAVYAAYIGDAPHV